MKKDEEKMKAILTSKGFENEITLKKIMDKIEKKIEDECLLYQQQENMSINRISI